mmetsp:Transcript_17178/g.49016  ORF Transcript_17178/g.49016 Transcript_17178/m.49016 type:complete len:232 (-) Transcript_17178:95-790(-)
MPKAWRSRMKLVRDLSRGVAFVKAAWASLLAAASLPMALLTRARLRRIAALSGASFNASVHSLSAASSLPSFRAHAAAFPNSRPAPSSSPASSWAAARFTKRVPASSKARRLKALSASRFICFLPSSGGDLFFRVARSVAPLTSWRLRGRRSPSMGVPLLRTESRGRFLLCFGGAVSFVRSMTGGPVTSTSESSAVKSIGLDITVPSRRWRRARPGGGSGCCSVCAAGQLL